MAVLVEYLHHENGPSQHEAGLRFTDTLSIDTVMSTKLVDGGIETEGSLTSSLIADGRGKIIVANLYMLAHLCTRAILPIFQLRFISQTEAMG